MTTPRRGFGELPPTIVVEPEIRTSAGSPVTARILITNRALEPRVMSVTTLGVDADWLPRPSRSRPLMPGETVAADLTFDPASGTIPAVYPLAVAVQALDPVGERATSATAIAETALVVDAPGQVDVQVRPTESSAYLRRRITVLVNNSGAADEYVRLEVHSTEAAEVTLDYETIEVPAGAVVPVRGRIRVRGRAFGRPQRFSYTVSARGSGSPRRVEGAVTTKAFLGNSATKFIVLCAIVVMWGAAAIIFIPKLASTIQGNQNKASDKVAAAQASAEAKGATPSGGASGSGGKNGAGGAGGAAGGAGGAAAGANGASSIQLAGTIAGQQPGGVHVGITPTSLVDEAAQAASPVGVDASSFSEIGKIPQSAVVLTSPANAVQSRATMSQTDGTWSFGNVKAPGYYLLVFAKPGYQTQQYIVDSSSSAATQPLAVTLVPGQGTLSGHITGPSGQVGAAQISISDGTNTITTSSNSKGDIGGWTVTGLSTPDSYVVTAGQNGLSTESRIVTLAAGGSSVVNLALKAGVGSLLGRVIGPNSLGEVGGLGGVQITATDGTNTRTASSVTPPTNSRSNIAGDFTLPDLPPGKYTLTAAETGYLPQTQSVTIKAGVSSVHVPTIALQSATASVTGRVVNNTLAGVNGAGLVLSSSTNTYKSITGSDGEFRIDGVTPGTYTLSAALFGFGTVYANVVAVAGQTVVVPTTSMTLQAQSFISNNSITGFIASAVSPSGTVTCFNVTTSSSSSSASPSSSSSSAPSGPCTITLSMTDDAGNPVLIAKKPASNTVATYADSAVLTPSTGGPTQYDIVGEIAGSTPASPATPLPAGLYHITIHATGFLTATVNVRVPFDGVGTAPQVNLFPADTIAGTIGGPGIASGGLQNDGPPASVPGVLHPPYANCVWVFPTDELPTSVPTSCPTQPTSSTAPLVPPTPLTSIPPARCDTSGLPDVRMAVIGTDGTYKIDNLCDGSYQAYLVVTNPWYVETTTPEVETVQHGQTATYSPTISRLGRVILTLSVVDPVTGASSLAQPGSGTASCASTASPPAPNISFGDTNKITTVSPASTGGKLTVAGVAAGPVVCTVTLTLPGAGGTATGSVSLTVNNNNDSQATLNLTTSVDVVWGRIVSPYFNSASNPVAGATVSITGTTGFDGSNPITQTVNVVTDLNGCFIVTKDGHDPAPGTIPTSSPCSTSHVSPNAGAGVAATVPSLALKTRVVTLTVPPGAGIVGVPTQTVTIPASGIALTANPTPISTSALQLEASQAGNLADATITVSPISAVGAGQVTASVDPNAIGVTNGNLVWLDAKIRQNDEAWPGTYKVTATLTGYGSVSANVTCTFNTSDCSFDGGPDALKLSAKGGLNGQIIAILGGPGLTYPSGALIPLGSYPTQLLPGATVIAAPCGTTCPTITGTTVPAGGLSAFTDSGGNFTLSPSNPLVMPPGQWTVQVSATGFTTWTTTINIIPGDNNITSNSETGRHWLFETPVTFDVGINVGTGLLHCPPAPAAPCASVTLQRVDTSEAAITVSAQNTADRFEFRDLNPATYTVTVQGAQIRAVTIQYTVPLSNNPPQPLDVPVTLIQNTISGSVLGLQGNTTNPTGLNGIPIELGTLDSTCPAGFCISKNVTGGNLIMTTGTNSAGVKGSFAFTSVPDGTYVARINLAATGNNLNYSAVDPAAAGVTPQSITVIGGQSSQYSPVTLQRATHNVTLSITTTDPGDTLAGTTATLTNAGDPTWSYTATPGSANTWTFNAIPADSHNWTLSVTLPAGHLGQIATLTCTAATSVTAQGSCHSASGAIVVPDRTGSDLNVSYNLDEFEVQLAGQTVALGTDGSATPPTAAALVVTDGSNTVYSNGSFPFAATPSVSETFWGATGTTYTAQEDSSVGQPAPNWKIHAKTYSTAGDSTTAVQLQELGATVKITIGTSTYTSGSATITLTVPGGSGITYSATPTPNDTPDWGTAVTYADVPFSTGTYTATLSGTYTTGSGASAVDHTISGSVSFSVGALTVNQTLNPTITPP